MLQEDSNGETGFEFVEKRTEDLSLSVGTAGSLSSMSTSTSTPSLIPSPGGSMASGSSSSTAVPGTGNLLSNVPPPSELPSFLSTAPVPMIPTVPAPQTELPGFITSQPPPVPMYPVQPAVALNLGDVPESSERFYPTQFSPAIPPSKGVGVLPQTEMPQAAEVIPGTGLFSWVKDAVSTGGILSKVAEKAKSSVDSMITTLDPQMREFIYSGGDIDILVASDKETKISPIREAFQSVFGKATVSGISVQPTTIAAQPVGFAAGIRAAEERIAGVYTSPQPQPLPVISVESFLLELGEDRWYDMAVLVLSDPANKIYLQTFTQTTPVPSAVISVLQEDTPADYPLRWSGFSITVGSVMSRNLQTDPSNWQQALCGVSRRETILQATRALAGLYKAALKEK